jgi:hypothetical protein
MAAPGLDEHATISMEAIPDAIPLVRLIFGILVAIGLYLTYIGWCAEAVSPSATNSP